VLLHASGGEIIKESGCSTMLGNRREGGMRDEGEEILKN